MEDSTITSCLGYIHIDSYSNTFVALQLRRSARAFMIAKRTKSNFSNKLI